MLSLRIINLSKILFAGDVQKITAPGVHGEFTILPEHLPFLTTLKNGVITYTIESSEQRFMNVPQGGGIFELVGSQATILLSSPDPQQE